GRPPGPPRLPPEPPMLPPEPPVLPNEPPVLPNEPPVFSPDPPRPPSSPAGFLAPLPPHPALNSTPTIAQRSTVRSNRARFISLSLRNKRRTRAYVTFFAEARRIMARSLVAPTFTATVVDPPGRCDGRSRCRSRSGACTSRSTAHRALWAARPR